MNETTLTSGALVLQTTSPYRTIAQKHWGLTKEQMKGMHVHHRIPQSEGGTNDPSNLYVCSPWFHANVWHDQSYWIETQALACSMGGKANTIAQQKAREIGQNMPASAKQKAAAHVSCLKLHANGATQRGRLRSAEVNSTPIKLTCISTGEEFYFSSQLNACKALKISPGNLCSVLKGNRNKANGFVAEYIKSPKLRHVN